MVSLCLGHPIAVQKENATPQEELDPITRDEIPVMIPRSMVRQNQGLIHSGCTILMRKKAHRKGHLEEWEE